MPQLDVTTYRGQVSSVVIGFGLVYRLRRSEVLPSRNRAVKRRSKKTERRRTGQSDDHREVARVEAEYGRSMAGAAAASHGLLQDRVDTQTKWVDGKSSELRKGGKMGKARAKRVSVRRESQAKRRVRAKRRKKVRVGMAKGGRSKPKARKAKRLKPVKTGKGKGKGKTTK
jgi:hypothetical protein